MAIHPADPFYVRYNGPAAIAAGCRLCKHNDVVRKERGAGRGWGFREGNKQRGRMIQHVKDEHPEAVVAELVRRIARAAR